MTCCGQNELQLFKRTCYCLFIFISLFSTVELCKLNYTPFYHATYCSASLHCNIVGTLVCAYGNVDFMCQGCKHIGACVYSYVIDNLSVSIIFVLVK